MVTYKDYANKQPTIILHGENNSTHKTKGKKLNTCGAKHLEEICRAQTTSTATIEDQICFTPEEEITVVKAELYYGEEKAAERKIPPIYLNESTTFELTWTLEISRPSPPLRIVEN